MHWILSTFLNLAMSFAYFLSWCTWYGLDAKCWSSEASEGVRWGPHFTIDRLNFEYFPLNNTFSSFIHYFHGGAYVIFRVSYVRYIFYSRPFTVKTRPCPFSTPGLMQQLVRSGEIPTVWEAMVSTCHMQAAGFGRRLIHFARRSLCYTDARASAVRKGSFDSLDAIMAVALGIVEVYVGKELLHDSRYGIYRRRLYASMVRYILFTGVTFGWSSILRMSEVLFDWILLRICHRTITLNT